ncbi:MAG: hypothetical protein M3326_01060 [Actinomycetota bacterium]|nr:hypothetical protein [Actinomycetota bacterium]
MPDASGTSRGASLRAAQQRLDLTVVQVWLGYVGVGGGASLSIVEGWLFGAAEPSAREHDLMAQSLNDHFIERGLNHPVPYAESLTS